MRGKVRARDDPINLPKVIVMKPLDRCNVPKRVLHTAVNASLTDSQVFMRRRGPVRL
jgi:hypothetical protein